MLETLIAKTVKKHRYHSIHSVCPIYERMRTNFEQGLELVLWSAADNSGRQEWLRLRIEYLGDTWKTTFVKVYSDAEPTPAATARIVRCNSNGIRIKGLIGMDGLRKFSLKLRRSKAATSDVWFSGRISISGQGDTPVHVLKNDDQAEIEYRHLTYRDSAVASGAKILWLPQRSVGSFISWSHGPNSITISIGDKIFYPNIEHCLFIHHPSDNVHQRQA